MLKALQALGVATPISVKSQTLAELPEPEMERQISIARTTSDPKLIETLAEISRTLRFMQEHGITAYVGKV